MTNVLSENAGSRLLVRRLLPATVALSGGLALLRYIAQEAGLFGTGVGIVTMLLATTLTLCALVLWTARSMRKLDHERLTAEADRDQFFALSADLIGVAGHDGFFKRVNPAFEQTLGYRFDELVTRPFIDLVHPDDVAQTVREMEKLAAGATTIDFENRYLCADGSYKWLAWTSVPDEASGLIYAIARDVSAQKAHAHERERLLGVLEAQNVRLRRLDRVKDRLIASVSHELRTPLMSIAGFTEALLDGIAKSEEERAHYLDIIHRNTKRLTLIVSDLLFVSEVDAGRLPIEVGDVELANLIEEAVASASLRAAEQQVAVIASCPGELIVRGDAHRLAQLVDNLVGNALKFTPPGGRVEISAGVADGLAHLTVSDTGIGIAEEELAQVFEPFFRTSSADRHQVPGSGLGLSIARAIMTAHGGSLEVSSRVDEGTTFTAVMPAAVELAVPV